MRAAAYMKQQGPFFLQLIRWDKPIGSFLLLWPTLTALWIASSGHPKPSLIVIFTLGVFVMRAAGCVLNDLTDRNIDLYVARTKQRPLANNQLSIIEALFFLLLLLCVALLLVLLLNPLCFKLAWVAVGLTAIYPLMKRVMPYPQVVLGLAFNWGVIMAFAATHHHIPVVGWLLYTIALIWTVAYDTIYAMVDRDDDIALGMQSSAISFGQFDVTIVAGLYGCVAVLLLLLGWLLPLHGWYFVAIVMCVLHFGWQAWRIRQRDPTTCLTVFVSNQWAWMLVFIGCLLGYMS